MNMKKNVIALGIGLMFPLGTVWADESVGEITMQVMQNEQPETITQQIHLPTQLRDQARERSQDQDHQPGDQAFHENQQQMHELQEQMHEQNQEMHENQEQMQQHMQDTQSSGTSTGGMGRH